MHWNLPEEFLLLFFRGIKPYVNHSQTIRYLQRFICSEAMIISGSF